MTLTNEGRLQFDQAKIENLVRRPHEEIVRFYQAKIESLLQNPLPYPQGRFKGQGIVICGGGEHYFPSAWVCINMLRDLGCTLPIELWYLGDQEMNADMIELVTALNVQCVDAHQVAKQYPVRVLHGWALKPYAIMHSQFEEVLYLDADNVPAKEPTFLFSTPEYQEYGAVFWSDIYTGQSRLLKREAWEICQVPYRDEPEFESGQLLINKPQCWRPLQLTMHLNEHSDFYYAFFYGDKDTFHLAWRRSQQAYALAPPCKPMKFGLFQHDFKKNILFQHRSEAKWRLQDTNPFIPEFLHDAKCRQFLAALKNQWSGKVRSIPDDFTPAERAAFNELVDTQIYRYRCTNSFDHSLLSEGFILFGADFTVASEHFSGKWMVSQNQDGQIVVTLRTHELIHCTKENHPHWSGRNLENTRMTYELSPVSWDELDPEQRKPLEFTLKWLDQKQDSLTAREQRVFEDLTRHRVYLYVMHTSPEFMPWMPTQGITAMMRNFTLYTPVDVGIEIGWTPLEHDDGEVVLGLKYNIGILGFCKQTSDQTWHGTVQILGREIPIELIPLGWNSFPRLPKLFYTLFVELRGLIFQNIIGKIKARSNLLDWSHDI